MSHEKYYLNKPQTATSLIHSGSGHNESTGSINTPIYATSTFRHGNSEGFDYTRSGNPNFNTLSEIIGPLEEAKYAVPFSSGVAAITAVVTLLKAGDTIVAEENVYGCTWRLFEKVFKKFNLNVIYTDCTAPDIAQTIIEHQPRLVWIESPTNPLLKVLDIKLLADATHKAGGELVVDNTFASSYCQKPLLLGADLSLSSTTKYLGGHSDALGGIVATNCPQWADDLEFSQKALGLNPSPFDAWLIAKGIRTLPLRMKQHSKNALFLTNKIKETWPEIECLYPHHPSHPQYDLAKKQMSLGSGIISFKTGLSYEKTLKFLKDLKWFALAESLGGVESLVCHPASMTHGSVSDEHKQKSGITPDLVRLSVGIEDPSDLWQDIFVAFSSVVENHELVI